MNDATGVAGDPRHAGMPPIDLTHRPLTFFEFWPPRLFYAPAALYWAWLSLRYGSTTLPTAANPGIPGGGLSGESKSLTAAAAGAKTRALIAPFVVIDKPEAMDADANAQAFSDTTAAMAEAGITFPAVAKPDIGCRGAGVRVVRDAETLRTYIEVFPAAPSFSSRSLSISRAKPASSTSEIRARTKVPSRR